MKNITGIVSDPNICGGSARVAGTRIAVWILEQARQLGTSEADLLKAFPPLCAEDLANAWAYVCLHWGEIEQEILENEAG